MRLQERRCLAPSLLSADFAALGASVKSVAPYSGVLHVDVMDGRFVPNITIGPPVVAALKRVTDLPLDCHLMIVEPDRYLADFARAGAGLLSVHQEACPHLHRTVQSIRELGMQPGVALNPATPIETLDEILPELDFVLIMSVNPGFGGQEFIPGAIQKVHRLRERIAGSRLTCAIQVDGGINAQTLPPLLEAGANWFVAGSAVFGAKDPAAAAKALQEALLG